MPSRQIYEATLQRPHCTALESVLFEGRMLVHTLHWLSFRGRLYHRPCRHLAVMLDYNPYRPIP